MTKKSNIKLDESKIMYHPDRLSEWGSTGKTTPITIDMALTQSCNYRCQYCYSKHFQIRRGSRITWKIAQEFLDDCAGLGVRGISLVSDGESTCNPIYADFITYGKKKGIDMALGTNGDLLTEKSLSKILPALTYLRFNVSAGTRKGYCAVHGVGPKHYFQVLDNIMMAVRLKKEMGLKCTIGLQMVLMPKNGRDIIPLAKAGRFLGVDYLVIKHCSDDEKGGLGIDYSKYAQLYGLLKEAETYSTDSYKVVVKWSKIKAGNKRNYSRCYGPRFHLQISGSGLVAPCGMLFSDKYSRYHIGDFTKQRFKDIVRGERYEEIMSELESDQFDARSMCGCLCLQHKTNEVLNKIMMGMEPNICRGEIEHRNFI